MRGMGLQNKRDGTAKPVGATGHMFKPLPGRKERFTVAESNKIANAIVM